MYKGLIVCDNDGTLLPFGHRKPESRIIQSIQELTEAGYLFCIASGRMYQALIKLYPAVKDQVVFICNNGGVIYYQGKVIMEPVFMDKKTAGEIAKDVMDRNSLSLTVSADGVFYVMKKRIGLKRRLYYAMDLKTEMIKDFAGVKKDILQISACFESEAEKEYMYFLKKWSDQVNVFYSGPGIIDFSPCNKGTGLLWVADHFRIPLENTYAAGDSNNDLPMLRTAGKGFLMANASKEMKTEFPRTCSGIKELLKDILDGNEV